ncbi:MAG: CHAT domain-containing protein [Cytophagaceae bacterium]|nr:CHAT domain-containing protein [Cytophagaceae bacterium]MDW8455747.1 CHAT domain-containing tetratricopeptide repeat protein [Cytophagaceae bacterium]
MLQKQLTLSVVTFFLTGTMLNAQNELDVLKNLGKKIAPRTPEKISKIAADSAKARATEARYKSESKTLNYAISLNDNAGLFENDKKLDKSSQWLMSTSNVLLDSKDYRDKASAYNNSGELLYSGGQFVLAEQAFKKAIEIYESAADTTSAAYALAISNIGLVYHTMGRYNKSELYTLKGMQLRQKYFGDTSRLYACSVNNMGVLCKDMGRYSESESLLNKAIKLVSNSEGKNSMAYAIVMNNKAVLLQTLGRYDEAMTCINESIATSSKLIGDKANNTLRLKTNYALLLKDMGKLQEAADIFNSAIQIKQERLGTGHPDYAHMLLSQASIYMLMGKYSDVERYLQRAAEIYKKKFGENSPAYAKAIGYLGLFYRLQSKYNLSETMLAKSLEIRTKTLPEKHPELIDSRENLALLYWQMNQPEKAEVHFDYVIQQSLDLISRFFPSMSENEKAKLWDKMRPKILNYYAFAVSQGTTNHAIKMYNLHISTKGILMSTSNKIKQAILNSKDKALMADYEKWIDLKNQLVKFYAYSNEELKQANINLDSLENVTNELEKKLSLKSSVFTQGVKSLTTRFEVVKESLAPSEAAVEIINYKKFNGMLTDTSLYVAMIVTKDDPAPTFVPIENSDKLDKRYFNYYNNCIRLRTIDEYSYNMYWKPIEQNLKNNKIIYLSLDGIYNQININSLRNTEGKYVIDYLDINFVSNTKYIKEYKANMIYQDKNKLAVLIGFPNYGNTGTVPPLPGTQSEVKTINAMLTNNAYKTIVHTQDKATEQNLKAISSPTVLHIATHGFFMNDVEETANSKTLGIETDRAKENPLLRSGLMLAGAEKTINAIDTKELNHHDNGILTAYEAMNLDLNNTDLVVLSACETAKGDIKSGEGVYGLQRAFQVAGASALIMSLWKVNDEATQKLMSNFYANWVKTKNKHLAFVKAQQELKKLYKDPYYWGAFVLLG